MLARPNVVLAHQDIIEEILSRLPVKSLLRFKCVSKPWNSLISSSPFARLHLERAWRRTNILTSTPSGLNLLDYETCFGNEVRLDFPPKRKDRRVRIMGSCHGLLAVALKKNKDFFLWNPSTRDFKKLPDPCFPLTRAGKNKFQKNGFFPAIEDSFLNGFGYDSSTDDYKVFFSIQKSWCRLLMPNYFKETIVAIFSLRKASWRMIQSSPTNPLLYPHENLSGSFVNGALHWLSSGQRQTEEILAFDLQTERFSRLPVPNKGIPGFSTVSMGVLDGRLCLTFYNHKFYLNQPPSFHPVEIWEMKEYGVKESWTKMVTIGDSLYHLPICISQGNNQVISINEEKDLIRSDAEESISEKFRICKCPENLKCFSRDKHPCQAIVYAESLLSPNVKIIQGRNRKRKNML